MIWAQVGERVERIRKERKLSRAQFGRMIGVSGQYVGMVEKGRHSLSGNLIVNICHITGISADYILFGTVNPTQDPDTTVALNGISPEQIQIALDIIKKVAAFIKTEDGNEALIREVAGQQHKNTIAHMDHGNSTSTD